MTICEKNNVINTFGVEATHDFLYTRLEALIDLRCPRWADHLDLRFQTSFVLMIRGRNNHFGAVAERYYTQNILESEITQNLNGCCFDNIHFFALHGC